MKLKVKLNKIAIEYSDKDIRYSGHSTTVLKILSDMVEKVLKINKDSKN